jgi:dephospho-CoA kinase
MTRSKSRVIGLTGGIATGKSTAASIIRNRGYVVIDADEIAREILEPGQPGYSHVVKEFSNSILTDKGTVDRKKLGDLVFTDAAIREKLDSLLHPIISDEILKNLASYKSEHCIFIDIPLLFEVRSRMEHEGLLFDEIWLVYADKDTQLTRLTRRSNLTEKEAQARVNSQMDIEQKKNMADAVIDNTGSREELEVSVVSLLAGLKDKTVKCIMPYLGSDNDNVRNGR